MAVLFVLRDRLYVAVRRREGTSERFAPWSVFLYLLNA